jgi:hypothetical protein
VNSSVDFYSSKVGCLFCTSLSVVQVSRLMDLIVHSLYSNKEVFFRELVRLVFC